MQFGDLIKQLRQDKDIGIKSLAPELDITYTYLSKLENNKVTPSAKVIENIASYFKYDLDELLLSANKIPNDIRHILQHNPKEAVEFLRKKFGKLSNGSS